ncbi:SDR family NAD(P)-dependent oxidoreductase [Paenibacillus sp. V4I5]|uniref:SDR family NAD(P)-dependent oxidoreductase n=1 Tax=Paenibacillus sp. V4I5 TaxID=3042306 RepID=UPI00278F0263|nr:SDR family NAD(P)-dependent oxidoreductase [Paenibacillus sp. V4I5]MDQ0914941.1 NAD(P)-dependent dehydrogenase (short-subunit alcohol dehydrogenase family) [Paenibacillus sp. V4I5]
MDIQGKVFVITGGSSGLGKAMAIEMVNRGANVVINGRREQALAEVAKEIDPTGKQVRFVAGNVADPKTAQRLIDESLAHYGRIDTLVNNAGIFMSKPFTEYSEEDFAAYLSTNVVGFFHVTQRAVAEMLKQGTGHIVTITTSLVDQPSVAVPSVLASLTKGGLKSATKSLAIEYASKGIRVNAVSPGVIKTPMHPVESHDALAKLHPMGRMGESHDIVEAVLYLDSANFVTGEILYVDGGQNAGH